MTWLWLLRSELLVQFRDRLFIILLFVAPAFLILILHDAWKAMLPDRAEADIQIYVGMAVFFGFSVATYAGHAFNREVEWGSLENTMSFPTSQLGLIISKAIPPVALGGCTDRDRTRARHLSRRHSSSGVGSGHGVRDRRGVGGSGSGHWRSQCGRDRDIGRSRVNSPGCYFSSVGPLEERSSMKPSSRIGVEQ